MTNVKCYFYNYSILSTQLDVNACYKTQKFLEYIKYTVYMNSSSACMYLTLMF